MPDEPSDSWPGPAPAAPWDPPAVSEAPAAAPPRPGSRRRVAGVPIAVWAGVAGAVAVAGIVGGALLVGRGDSDPRLAIDVAGLSIPAHTGVPTTLASVATAAATVPRPSVGAPGASTAGTVLATAPATVVSAPETRPASPDAADGLEPTEPLPAGVPERSTFDYTDSFGGEWTGTVAGLVELPLAWPDDDAGNRCFAALGTVSPVTTDGIVSESWSTPYLSLFVDGVEADLSDVGCDLDALTAAGYRSLFEANVTAGTEFAFYTEFSLPVEAGHPQAIAVSQAGDAWRFFDATLLGGPPPIERGLIGELPIEPVPIGEGSPAAFTHVDDYTGDTWSGSILGLVEVPAEQQAGTPGTCFAVIGTLTAESVGSGATTAAYAAPAIAIIADGRLVDDYFGCSDGEVDAAGYGWFNDTEITPGTTVHVYATLVVPQPFPAELQAIVVGDPWSDAPNVFTPHLVSRVDPVEVAPGPPPGGPLASAGEAVTVLGDEDTAWSITVHGWLPEPAPDGVGECVTVLASTTLTAAEGAEWPPELSLIAGGHRIHDLLECTSPAAEAVGYLQQFSDTSVVGVRVHTYGSFRIPPDFGAPQAIVIGGFRLSQGALVAPTVLDAVPPIAG